MNQQWPIARRDEHLPAQPGRLIAYAPARRGTHAKETVADLGDLWRIVLRRRAIILGTTLACLTAAVLYSFLATSLYSATSQLLIDPRDRQVVNRDLNASTVAPDGGITVVESQVKVIESDSVLLRAIAETGLEDDPDFGAPPTGLLGTMWRNLEDVLFAPGDRERNRKTLALVNLRRKLAVKRADKVFVVDIIVTATSPDKAARIVNAIAKAYLADQADARAEAAKRASSELSSRLDDLRADVNKAETQLEAFKAKNGLITSSGRLVSEQQLTNSNARLVAARNRTAEAKSRLQDLRTARGAAIDTSALPEAIQSLTIERLRAQYAELASKEGDLRTQLGARHPFIASVRTQKADVKRLIDIELDRIVKSAEIDYQRALTAERLLADNLGELKAESVQTNKATVPLRELERAVAASRSVYDTYLVRSREIAEQANVDPTNARVITWAQPPQERSWPLRGLIIIGGLAGGLGFGVGFAMLREYAKPTLLSRGQLERFLAAPVLAVFPPSLDLGDVVCAREAIVALDGLHGLSAYPQDRERALIVVVTAAASDAEARKGMTELLAATAIARGDRVLFLEADLSAPEVGAGGLLEVLRGEMTFHAAARNDAVTGARRIGIGNGNKPVRDAFDRANVAAFLDHAGSRFDLILVDGGALSSNLRIGSLVANADKLVVVARAGRTLQSDVIDLDRVASAMGRPAFGALLVDDRANAR